MPIVDGDAGGPSKVMKDKDPNWNKHEILALVRAKRAKFIQELECDDPRELMNLEMSKWKKILVSVNAGPRICCYRSLKACIYKWQTLLLKYKHLANIHKDTRVNSMLYF